MSDAVLDTPTPGVPEVTPRARPLLAWPPPGLVRMQGDLWKATRELGGGGIVLVLPLLWVTVSEQSFWSLGPLGESWWLILITSLFGLMIVVTGFVDLFRLLRRSAKARERGYGTVTILMVVTDDAREAGFVLQGSRSFSALGSRARRRILHARIGTGLAMFGASFWMVVSFIVGVLLASRGGLSPEGLAMFTLGPTALLSIVGTVLRSWEQGMVRRARRAWFHQPWSQELTQAEVETWQEEAERRTSQVGLVSPSPGGGGGFRLAAGVVAVTGLLVVSLTAILAVTSAVSPVMAMIAVPKFSRTQQRAAEAEFLRRYALPPDSLMSPQEGGQIFHLLSFVGDPIQREMELLPARAYQDPWYPDRGDGNPLGIPPETWRHELFPALAAGQIDAEGRAYLEQVATHPAHEEFARAALAPSADLAGARYRVPFEEGTTIWRLPLPRYRTIREGAYAHVARAAWLASRGDMAEAEQTLRQVVSVGLRLADDGPFLIDNLLGVHIAEVGADGLQGFYRYAGRSDESATLEWARQTAERATSASRIGGGITPLGALTEMPAVVTDGQAIRGLRWEFLTSLNTLSPCLNLHRMVFGPDPEYQQWLADAEDSLVRFPGEEEMFELARAGVFGRKGEEETSVLGAVLALPLGGGETAGSCARFFGAVSAF